MVLVRGMRKKGLFFKVLERKEMMKASICFFSFLCVVAPSCKDWGLGFFFSFRRVYELQRKVWKSYFRLVFSFVCGSRCYLWHRVVFIG